MRRGNRPASRILAGLAIGLLWLSSSLPASEGSPRLSLDEGGRAVLAGLPALPMEPDVRRYLDSGLTTTFLFQARLQRGDKPVAARIDVRLELWDEVYLLTVADGEGVRETQQVASAEELAGWWSDAQLVLASAEGAPSEGSRVKVTLAIVPFSHAELADTQRWLIESIGQGGSGSGRGSTAVGALIATSMQRRAVKSMSWNVMVDRLEASQ